MQVPNGTSDLFETDVDQVRSWESSLFDELVGSRGLVVCGAGGLGRKTITGLHQVGSEVSGVVDNDPAQWGKLISGVRVYSPTEAVTKFGKSCTFIVAIWGAHSRDKLSDRKRQWETAGCESVISFRTLFWKYPDVFLPHYALDLPHKVYAESDRINRVSAIFSDEYSRQEYREQLLWRLRLDYDGLPEPVSGPTYFPADLFKLSEEENLVDCGAFDGDTLREFLRVSRGKFAKVWAFEPDAENCTKLQTTIASIPSELRARVKVFPLATGSSARKLRFQAGFAAASAVSDAGEIEVDCDALDALLKDEMPTFIKMDIEGGEPDALRGAVDILRRCRPILAVSVYHLQSHLWSIPETLSALLDNYRFFLRPHDREGWDLVLYAVPAERLLR